MSFLLFLRRKRRESLSLSLLLHYFSLSERISQGREFPRCMKSLLVPLTCSYFAPQYSHRTTLDCASLSTRFIPTSLLMFWVPNKRSFVCSESFWYILHCFPCKDNFTKSCSVARTERSWEPLAKISPTSSYQ